MLTPLARDLFRILLKRQIGYVVGKMSLGKTNPPTPPTLSSLCSSPQPLPLQTLWKMPSPQTP